MQAVIDDCLDPATAGKWAAQPKIAGRDVQELFRLVRKSLTKLVRQKEVPLGDAIKEYVDRQPRFVRKNLKRILGSAQIVSTKRVRDILVDELSPIVEAALSDPSASIVFFVGHFVSSSMLAVLLFLHGIRGSPLFESICERASIVTSASALPKDCNIMVVEDSAYSGASLATSLHELANVISHRQPVHIVLPVATDEAVSKIEATCKKAHLYNASTVVGIRAGTLFHGMSEADVLMMDVYIGDNGSVKSFLFDVLGLDDRQCLVLLQHKVDDLAMVPHKLLHVGPVFPSCDAAFSVPLHASAEEIIGAAVGPAGIAGQYSRNAKVSDYVKKHWRTVMPRFTSVGGCRRKGPTDQLPLLPPPLLRQGYASMLHAFT